MMKQISHLHVIFSDHKCYMVDKGNKKAIALGIEKHTVLTNCYKEHALLARVFNKPVNFGIKVMDI